jgi:hypothetical protein
MCRVQSQLPRSYDPLLTSQNGGARLHSSTVNVLRSYPEFGAQVRLGYTVKDSFYEDEGEWTKCRQIVTKDGCFWRHGRL